MTNTADGVPYFEPDTEGENDAPEEVDVATDDVEVEETESPTEGTDSAEDGTDEEFDADRALEKIRKTNSENRNLRKRLAAAEAKIQDKGDEPDDREELRKENARLKGQVSEAARKRIAAQYGLPESIAVRLQGDEESDWIEDAEALAAELRVNKPKRTNNPGASKAEGKPALSKADEFFAF